MKNIAQKISRAVMFYLKWGWPLLVAAGCLSKWGGQSEALWRSLIDDGAFAWILCTPVAPITLLLDRARRERAMARLCGLREGDERERAITGEAARSTLLLALSLQTVLLAMSLISVHLVWNPLAHKKNEHGLVWVGLAFSSRHLDPFGTSSEGVSAGMVPSDFPTSPVSVRFDSFIMPPSSFSVLLLLILIQLAAFRAFATRKYEGTDV